MFFLVDIWYPLFVKLKVENGGEDTASDDEDDDQPLRGGSLDDRPVAGIGG